MDLTRASLLREMLSGTELGSRTTQFGYALRRFTTRRSGLMLFGPVDDEPWHLTAHLDDELHRAGVEDLRPSLVRWAPPPGAPPHLSIGLDRLRDAGRGESLLVVAEDAPADRLLERISDVRRRGTTIFSIGNGDNELTSLSHETLVPELLVPDGFGWTSRSLEYEYDEPQSALTEVDSQTDESFETAQHLVSLAAADEEAGRSGWRRRLRNAIERLSGEPA
ncbi:hypothetical protein EV649_5781 [Kribbella sp. VKM Ac-2569]|uniref:hypothetical protein n=1 Tax=Kribbella sp. VKM Ac-2569 TaxID=2512220 RepID=UPI00102BFA56|nr:hypothetical protein [Kribbella sp. VKM Ac-2569]RZT15000.1 hypothetical protein EV649_5781 [Kribbella sp. VKM Ac-2569]